jgi:UDP-GlcNAc:undecaprenyl-phosphate GlcNAc-1-phosphate transferase
LFEISFIFTVICFAVMQICLNMYDGINLQSSIYYKVLILFFLAISNDPGLQLFCVFTLIYLLFFSFYNYKGLIFFGDNGVYIFSFIISLMVIKLYNTTTSINVENILIIFLFPFLDLIRLFLYRLGKNQNPLDADRNHIQHILLKKYGLINTNLIIILPLITSMLLFHLLKMNLLLLIIVNIIVYMLIIKQKVND